MKTAPLVSPGYWPVLSGKWVSSGLATMLRRRKGYRTILESLVHYGQGEDMTEPDLAEMSKLAGCIAFCVVFFGAQQAARAEYTPQIHASQMRKAVVKSQFGCRQGCLKLIAGVQELADDRSSEGDKSDGRFYLHFVWPKRGYALTAHRQVLAELGLLESGVRAKASLDEFVLAAEQRAQIAIASMVRDSGGELGNQAAGQILYIIGTLRTASTWKEIGPEAVALASLC